MFAALRTIAPGPDLAVVLRNAVRGGRARGLATAAGVVTSLLTLRWVGIGYLTILGARALWHAARPGTSATDNAPAIAGDPSVERHRDLLGGWRQGVLTNLTNPKVLAFYVTALPQFLDPATATPWDALLLATAHAVLAVLWLTVIVGVVRAAARWLTPTVRRRLDALTGAALLDFAGRLAWNAR